MSDPLTFGMGQEPSAYLTWGFGTIVSKIVEKIKEIIRYVKRIIPIHRVPFKFTIQVRGNASLPLRVITLVQGSPVFIQTQTLPTIGEPVQKTRISSKILGNPSIPISSETKIVGETSHSLSSQVPISGDLSVDLKKEILCKGKRDQRDLIWAILDNDEEEG